MGISFFINNWLSISKENRTKILHELYNISSKNTPSYDYILNALSSYEQQFQNTDDKIYLFYMLELYPCMSIIFEALTDEISNINFHLTNNKNDLKIYNL